MILNDTFQCFQIEKYNRLIKNNNKDDINPTLNIAIKTNIGHAFLNTSNYVSKIHNLPD